MIGQLPTTEEVRAFLADDREDKRAAVVDALLRRPEFPDVWAMTWAEVLRIEPQNLEPKGVHIFTRWLREALRDGAPMDDVVRRMLTASGSAFRVPEANYWATAIDAKVLAEKTRLAAEHGFGAIYFYWEGLWGDYAGPEGGEQRRRNLKEQHQKLFGQQITPF